MPTIVREQQRRAQQGGRRLPDERVEVDAFAADGPFSATVKLGEHEAAVTAPGSAYLEIESHRYGERLVADWIIAPETLTAQIPPFALTTLVDNAVNHGIATRGHGGRAALLRALTHSTG